MSAIKPGTHKDWEDVDDSRIDVIGQNGNTGEHYSDKLLCQEIKEQEAELVGAGHQQVGGDHYMKHKIQPWDIIDVYGLNFYEGNAIKYLLRRKGDRVEDLKKSRHYIEKLIELEMHKG